MAAQNKKRPMYIQNLLNEVNTTLKAMKHDGEHSSLHIFMCHYLIQHKCYRGYNFYKDKFINGEVIPVLAGSATDYDYIQIW